jgi:threonine dehydratase
VLSNKIKVEGKNIVCLISGGNIDIAMISKIIDRQLVLLKRRLWFNIKLQDKVGQLGELINKIGAMGANIVRVRQERNWEEKGLDFANVSFEMETDSKEHSLNIINTLKDDGYEIEITC